ncbi:pilus assembly PilX family protein [Thermomonas flagellata]|uniref:pilus assembly PilX family protein n=1 Tax=Thermomonas flagellata TaxID=2888524 RepID=UPI001F05057F|nr:PilX N-terminal domain-containing pilus assembly protein [Thermomonas flagellata]
MSVHFVPSASRRRQQGISLLVVLLLLIVMSVLGIAVLRSSALQERMSANLYDRNLALQAAERALAVGRQQLADSGAATMNPAAINASLCASQSICPTGTAQAAATWRPVAPDFGAGNPNVPDTPAEYWIEYLGENQAYMETGGTIPASATANIGPMFRITARSQAPGRASAVLQSDVIYRFPRL